MILQNRTTSLAPEGMREIILPGTRSAHRDAILDLLAEAPAEGMPVTEIMMAVPEIGNRAAADQMLHRMVSDNEIVRTGRGRYGPLRPRRSPPVRDVAPPPAPEPPKPALQIPAAPAPNGHANGAHQHQAPKPGIPADPGVSLRDELARELIERRLGIKEDQPVEAPRPLMDLDTFFAMISAMYGKHGLCPPFKLRGFASSWIAAGISPEHCLDVVDRHLREHAASCRSGSGDRLMPYLDKVIRFEWNRSQHP
jgi:hypothetical protein